MSISIFILTLNEEKNIRACIESVSFSDDIVLLDSYSKDTTVSIAKEMGARIYKREFDNWSSHQNWAMQNIDFKYDWVFYLDADERMTCDLREEILKKASNNKGQYNGFVAGRINYFMGKPITHCYPPVPILRFFKPSCIRYKRLVNPIAIIEGRTGKLESKFLHYNFSKGLTEWFEKHNKYSLAEAKEAFEVLNGKGVKLSLFDSDAALRRVALKNLALTLPGRPILKFFYLYVLKFGFLDGRAGFTYCILQSIYEHMIDLKIMELKLRYRGKNL